MSDLLASVNGIFEKIAEVIDLSFFPPGAACLAAGLYWNEHAGFFSAGVHGPGSWPGWFQAGGALLGSYALGLLCFSAGRFLRSRVLLRTTEAELASRLRNALDGHGAAAPPLCAEYLSRGAARPLHTRMWAEIREDALLRESYRLLQHYWVLTATYDGMAAAFVVWAGVILHLAFRDGLPAEASAVAGRVVAAVISLLLTAACAREARRLQSAQVDELAATLAHREARTASTPTH